MRNIYIISTQEREDFFMRITNHNARAGKDGVFSAKHNDRNFDISKAEHIDSHKSQNNIIINLVDPNSSFEDGEKLFYENHFRQYLDARNKKYEQSRHYKEIKSMDEYRKSNRTSPEECIYQIGNADETVAKEELMAIVNDLLKWQQKTFPNVNILNVALHADEQGAPHIHVRQVWVGHNKDGNEVVSQNKALEEMGIQPPEPDKPIGRYNNAKQTYTRAIRDKLTELCQECGLNIETEPKSASETGLELLEYKRRQEQKKLDLALGSQKKLEEIENTAKKTMFGNNVTLPEGEYQCLLNRAAKADYAEDKYCEAIKMLNKANKRLQDADKIDLDKQIEFQKYDELFKKWEILEVYHKDVANHVEDLYQEKNQPIQRTRNHDELEH